SANISRLHHGCAAADAPRLRAHFSSCPRSLFSKRPRPPPTFPLFPYTPLFRSQAPRRRPHPDPRGHRRRRQGRHRQGLLSGTRRSEEHTSELQSLTNLVCRLLLEKKNKKREACPTPHSPSTAQR